MAKWDRRNGSSETASRKALPGPELHRAVFLFSDEIRWAAGLARMYRVFVHDDDAPGTGIGRSGSAV